MMKPLQSAITKDHGHGKAAVTVLQNVQGNCIRRPPNQWRCVSDESW